ncbi:unnamed protein product [Rhizophagus irregularis]|nr:unnamed protein product [Rhizophagus irregularis]
MELAVLSHITFTDLYQFIVKIFTAMCNEQNGNILRETLGFGSDGRILETNMAEGIYRIEFLCGQVRLGNKTLRDGEDMAKHKRRFEPGGKYKEIVKYVKSIAYY